MAKRALARNDILPIEEYGRQRQQRRRAMTEIKRKRRLAVGPDATFHFENFDTMWYQIHEMLYVERGGEEQIAGEIVAYNPLIPKGGELVSTLMFEIDDEARRDRVLSALGGVEHTITISFEGKIVTAKPEGDVDRTNAEGKTSSVHFLHFPFTPEQVEKFRTSGTKVIIGIDHAGYGHMAAMQETLREVLAADL